MAEGTSTPPSLWNAVWQMADAWSESPIVKEFSATLPRNLPIEERGDKATGVAALLQHLESSGGGALRSPLMYGSRVPAMRGQPAVARFGEPAVDDAEWQEWQQRAQRIERAHRVTLGWLRSGLSGYPMLRAPQLATETPLTTFELTFEFIWHKEEFGSRLNLMSAPPDVPDLLGADRVTARKLDAAARELATQLGQSVAWLQFDEAMKSLDDSAKESLSWARKELKKRLSEDRLDEHEANLAMPRSEYRSHMTAEVIETLSGPARSYADAFTDVHRLLTLTVCDAFGELALYGEPWPVQVVDIETAEPGEPIIEFRTHGAVGAFIAMGQILWLRDSAVADAVRVESKNLRFDLANGTRDLIQARVLLGTADGWPASSAAQ